MNPHPAQRVSLAEIRRRLGATLLAFEHALPAKPRDATSVVLERSEGGVPPATVLRQAARGSGA